MKVSLLVQLLILVSVFVLMNLSESNFMHIEAVDQIRTMCHVSSIQGND
jgi:hypothetical protein